MMYYIEYFENGSLLFIIGSGNSSSPEMHQTITSNNTDWLSLS